MARRRFFVDSVHSGHSHIAGADAHHLTRVLRVEPGQKFEISDNRDVYLAEIESARKDLVSFAILERIAAPEPAVNITLLASLIKFERFEWIVEKATELGAGSIVPVEAERSERGLARAAIKRLERWKRIAREASEQSRRARLPEVGTPIDLAAALATPADHRFVLEEEQAPGIVSVLPAQRMAGTGVALLVGPEGGWTDRERSSFAGAAWQSVSLGPQILRAETAVIAGLAVLNAAWDK
ncbi:MAG TPA: RsmE family RNA methyltransferase [Bryobacteraceae bacterium]